MRIWHKDLDERSKQTERALAFVKKKNPFILVFHITVVIIFAEL